MHLLQAVVFSSLVAAVKFQPHSPIVPGTCMEPALGKLAGQEVEARGVTSMETCAQYAFDMNKVSNAGSSKPAFVSYGVTADDAATPLCAWFAACACVSGGLCGDQATFRSVQISDLIKPPPTVPSVPLRRGNFAVSMAVAKAPAAATKTNTAPDAPPPDSADPLATPDECSDSFVDLMKTFQSKCEFSRSVTYKRFVALCILAASLVVCAAGFGLAHFLQVKASN